MKKTDTANTIARMLAHSADSTVRFKGDPDLVHIDDTAFMGVRMADQLEIAMRRGAERAGDVDAWQKKLCPGCYMTAGVDMLIVMAQRNGQDLRELAASIIGAMQVLQEGSEADGMACILEDRT